MKAGDSVIWKNRTTFVRSLETITRSDGSQLECAVLACNRFVPVELLESCHVERKPMEAQSQSRVFEGKATEPEEENQTRRKVATDSVERSTAGSNDAFRLTPASGGRQSPDETRIETRSKHNQGIDIPRSPECGPLLIDFNNLFVRAWHAGKPSEIHAVKSMFLTVAAAVRSLRPSGIVFCMDGGHEHRAKLYPAYKAHRPPSDPDLARQRKLAMDAIDVAGLQLIRAEGFEADDVIASYVARVSDAGSPGKLASETRATILSSDKDLLSLAGHARIYHPWGAGKFVTPEEVLGVYAGQVTDFLALCGDPTDGVPGVKGIGEKTAQKLLSEHGDLETILVKARVMHIAGTMGKNLRDGTADALLSQQLVQLVTNLRLAELQPWKPRHGWQQRLTQMRLGAIAGILDGIVNLLASGGRQSPDETRTDARPELRTNRHQGIDIPRSPDIRPGSVGFSPPTDEQLTWLRRQYEQGRKHAGQMVMNPWRRDSPEHVAWDQGFRNVPFSMDAESPAESREPATTAAGSLFD